MSKRGDLAQLARASALQAEGRRFEPVNPHHLKHNDPADFILEAAGFVFTFFYLAFGPHRSLREKDSHR